MSTGYPTSNQHISPLKNKTIRASNPRISVTFPQTEEPKPQTEESAPELQAYHPCPNKPSNNKQKMEWVNRDSRQHLIDDGCKGTIFKGVKVERDDEQHQRESGITKDGGVQSRVRESIAIITSIVVQGCGDPSGIGNPHLLSARC